MRWFKDDNSYILRSDSNIVILRTRTPAVVYNAFDGILYRTGDYGRCLQYYQSMRSDLYKVGDTASINKLKIFKSSTIDVSHLNQCIISGCALLHERLTTQ